MSFPDGTATDASAYTAFGELRDGTNHRYGYAGTSGYQAHDEFSLVHVGARYYDPSIGRFVQRDPIGIRGGFNVYAYVSSLPTTLVDPSGEFWAPAVRAAARFGPKAARGAWAGARWVGGKAKSAAKWTGSKVKSGWDKVKRIRIKPPEYHRTPHPFPIIGPRSHLQCTIYLKGIKGSGINIRIPLL